MADKADPDKTGTIVAAARKRFGHYGLAKTTMNEIASDVGMSKASLYYYFPDKEHLFLEVIRLEMENFFTEINRLTSRSIAPADQLRQYVELRFDSFGSIVSCFEPDVRWGSSWRSSGVRRAAAGFDLHVWCEAGRRQQHRALSSEQEGEHVRVIRRSRRPRIRSRLRSRLALRP